MTLAAAAATGEFVVALSRRRKSLADRRDELDALLTSLQQLRQRFLDGADQDIAVLTTLLSAQSRARRAETETERARAEAEVHEALITATKTPIALSEAGIELLGILKEAVALATRFTVSDLGAAAALAQGAIEAILLMGEVNLALLAGAPEAAELRATVDRLHRDAPALAAEVLQMTRTKMAGGPSKEKPSV